MKTTLWLVGETTFLMVVATIVGCAGSSEIPPVPPDLAGSWALDRANSDSAHEELRQAMAAARQGGPPAGRRAGGGGGSGKAGGRPGRGNRGEERVGGDPQDIQDRMQRMLAVSDTLSISQTDSILTLISRFGSQQFRPDGGRRETYLRDMGEVEIKARWKEGRLVIERKLRDGFKLTQTYERPRDGQRMQLEVKLSGARLPSPVEFRLLYDAAPEGQTP